MRAEVLGIGSELLSGATVNTNAAYLARRLGEVGIVCHRLTVVGDEPTALTDALREARRRSELIVTTGGLGPTDDDRTVPAIAEALGRPVVRSARVASTIRRVYARHRRRLVAGALRQADLPAGAQPIPNRVGTAPGLWLPLAPGLLIALPGVPREMRPMVDREVLPRLRRVSGRGSIATCTLRTIGLVELEIQRRLARLHLPETIEIGLYPQLRAVDVRLTARGLPAGPARRTLAVAATRVRRALGPVIYGMGDERLEEVVGSLLRRQRQTLALAESCTGGLISDRLTDVAGSSRYLRGAVVAYHNDLKRACLGVSPGLLARPGAVSAPTARAMAQGVRRVSDADVGLSVTGIAGPGGGSRRKPVGLVYLGLAGRRGTVSVRCQFLGDREMIKALAAQAALDWLRRYLLKRAPRH